jgi:hypothetical protein
MRAERVLHELRELAAGVAISAFALRDSTADSRRRDGRYSRASDLDDRQRELNDQLHALWLIWGSLTDWVENRPAEAAKAEAEMRRAAAEWLAVPDDDEALWRPFFDRWVYEEIGYTRPRTKGAS